jgi:hypothetical protein
MAVEVKLTDNSVKVKAQIDANLNLALEAMGIKAVGLIVNQMETGYGKPIRQTGDLQRDVTYEVENSGPGTVDVGNTLHYGKYVHDGHAGHSVKLKDGSWITLPGGHTAGRPYIRDALTGDVAKTQLQTVAADALAQGFTET